MARRTVSRQLLMVHRLNRSTSALRSRIYRLQQNVNDNKFTEVRDIGPLPWTWDDFGFQATPHYIHSTVRGFNQDYKELTREYQLEDHFAHVRDQLTTILNREVAILQATAERDKMEFFGATSPKQPLKDTEYIKLLRQPLNPDKANATQIQQTLIEMKNASNWYTFEGQVLAGLNDAYKSGKISRAKFYDDVVEYVWRTWNQFINLPFDQFVTDEDDLKKIKQIIKVRRQTISRDIIRDWVKNKKTPNKNQSLSNFTSELGLVYEDAIRQSVVNYAIQRSKELIIDRIGKAEGLVDVALRQPNGRASTTIVIDDFNRFQSGISAKLKVNNKFEVKVSGTPQQFFQFAGEATDDQLPTLLEALRYLYNNWMALSVVNMDQGRVYSNARGRTRYRKAAKLADGNHLMGRIFGILGRIINLVMISSAFFANAKDIGPGNLCVFDPKYWTTLTAQLDTGHMTIPNFLITANDAYETWQVVQYYMDNNIVAPSKIFGSNGFFRTANPYDAATLHKLYNAKARALIDRKRKHPDLGLYDAIHTVIDAPLHEAFIDVFSTVLASDRKLSFKFRLIASDAL